MHCLLYRDIDMAEFLSSDEGVTEAHPNTVYNLVANICHDGKAGAGKGTYRTHIRHKVCVCVQLWVWIVVL